MGYVSLFSGVKVDVSWPEEDVDFLSAYAEQVRLTTRSAKVHEAFRSWPAIE